MSTLLLIAFRVVEPHSPCLVRAHISASAKRTRNDLVNNVRFAVYVLLTTFDHERIAASLAAPAQCLCSLKLSDLFNQLREVTGVTSVGVCLRKPRLGSY